MIVVVYVSQLCDAFGEVKSCVPELLKRATCPFRLPKPWSFQLIVMERNEPSTAKSELLRGHQFWKSLDAGEDVDTLLH